MTSSVMQSALEDGLHLVTLLLQALIVHER